MLLYLCSMFYEYMLQVIYYLNDDQLQSTPTVNNEFVQNETASIKLIITQMVRI